MKVKVRPYHLEPTTFDSEISEITYEKVNDAINGKINIYFDESVYCLMLIQPEISVLFNEGNQMYITQETLYKFECKVQDFLDNTKKRGLIFLDSDKVPKVPMMVFNKEPLFDLY